MSNNITVLTANTQATVVNPSARNQTVQLYNSGPGLVFAGSGYVTPWNGIPILPGSQLKIYNPTVPIYLTPNATTNGVASTVVGVGVTAPLGTTKWTVTTAAGFTTGATFIAGNVGSPTREVLAVASIATTVITSVTPALYAHVAAETVATAALYSSVVQVNQGTQ